MSLALAHITLDCRDAAALGAFWSAAIGRPLDDGASVDMASIGMGQPTDAPAWLFVTVPEAKSAKNRLHLDFDADDRAAEVARLTALGAAWVGEYDEYGVQWTTLTDPEGNEFCVASA